MSQEAAMTLSAKGVDFTSEKHFFPSEPSGKFSLQSEQQRDTVRIWRGFSSPGTVDHRGSSDCHSSGIGSKEDQVRMEREVGA